MSKLLDRARGVKADGNAGRHPFAGLPYDRGDEGLAARKLSRDAPFHAWSDAELKDLADHLDTPVEEAPTRVRRQLSTLQIVQPLTHQILSYQRALGKIWDRGVGRLSVLAGGAKAVGMPLNGTKGAKDEAAKIVSHMAADFLAAADSALPKAFKLGQDLAIKGLDGKSSLTEATVAKLIGGALKTNAKFVEGSLMKDLLSKFTAVLDDTYTVGEAVDQVTSLEETMSARVSLYALEPWGMAATGFGEEVQGHGEEIWWITTSSAPCGDCMDLADGSPYDDTNPLPTYPGAGETECLKNCLCLLTTNA